MGFLRTLAILVIIYYVFKLASRYLLPVFLKKTVERMQNQAFNQASTDKQKAQRQEGRVTVKRPAAKQSATVVSDNEGEYVDYEEVK